MRADNPCTGIKRFPQKRRERFFTEEELIGHALAAIGQDSADPPSFIMLGGGGLPEQAVPRAGLRLQRIYCRSRWIGGSTYLWLSRRRVLGARGPSSGLIYDRALPAAS